MSIRPFCKPFEKSLSVFLLAALPILALPSGEAAAASGNAQAVCKKHLTAIGRALNAYQKGHGQLPPHLSALHPRYLKDRASLLCPADGKKGDPGFPDAAKDPKLPVSYLYEMSAEKAPGRMLQLSHFEHTSSTTWRQVKLAQRANFGDRVPVVRCSHHSSQGEWLSLTLTGQIYQSGATWEFDPATAVSVLREMDRDLSENPARFPREWDPSMTASYFNTIRMMGGQDGSFYDKVPESLRRRLPRSAARLASSAPSLPQKVRGDALALSGLLYRAGGVNANAIIAFKKAMKQPGGSPVAGMMLGDLYASTGQTPKAVAFYEAEVKKPEQRNWALWPLTQLYRETGNTRKAIRLLEDLAANDPGNTMQYAGLLADAYRKVGETDKAAEWEIKADPGAQLVSRPAPDFELKDTAGQTVRLSDYKGKVVFLNFWAYG